MISEGNAKFHVYDIPENIISFSRFVDFDIETHGKTIDYFSNT
jgi:hypothetical protein